MRGENNCASVPCHIGVDVLGSDSVPRALLEAIFDFLPELSSTVQLTVFGSPALFRGMRSPSSQVILHPVPQIISMEEAPLEAIRNKKDSSLCTGIRLLKTQHIQAFITAGNTGALMGYAKLHLPLLPTVGRPALLALVPTKNTPLAVVDVGAHTKCEENYLIQSAAMGIAYQRARGLPLPRVGLLNIGSEAKKGTPTLQKAYNRLKHWSQSPSSSFCFVGNIEGRDAFHGEIDVLVTDGFTGNIFLKTAEGIATVILDRFEQTQEESVKSILKHMRTHLDYTEYPGALLCGVEGIVLKCHGNVTAKSLTRSIAMASCLAQHSFLSEVKKALLDFSTSKR